MSAMNIHETIEKGSRPQPAERAAPRSRGSFLTRSFRMAMKALVPLAVLAVGVAGFMYLRQTKPETPKRPPSERAFAVRTITVEPGRFQPTLTLYGTTVAGRQVDIRALVAGRVVETGDSLREGGRAEKGEMLLRIDDLDYRTTLAEAEAQLAESRARVQELQASLAAEKASLSYAREQLKLAEADLERAQPLARTGAVSERTLDDRRQTVLQRRQTATQLENSLAVWNARLAQQQATTDRLETIIERARQRLADTRLEAPFDAYVTDAAAQTGRMLGVNDKVATLIDRHWIEARFSLSDEQFGRIVARDGSLEGRSVTVHWLLGGNRFSYDATIERVGARIASDTGGVEVFARIAEPENPLPIRPGAFVEVNVPDAVFTDVFRLPSRALYAGDTVYVVSGDRLSARKVELVGGDGDDILVSGGLKAGEKVLATRISTPGEGVLVREVPPA